MTPDIQVIDVEVVVSYTTFLGFTQRGRRFWWLHSLNGPSEAHPQEIASDLH